MKIVALLPVKNEEWVLPSYLSSVSKIADEIIALDDSSIDESVAILRQAGVVVHTFKSDEEKVVNMSARRQILLDAGRRAGGTHFIWLDADETFSANFISKAKATILSLKPGEKISMRWVHLWKDVNQYLNDKKSSFGFIWKDFIVCDDGSNFNDVFLSEARTQGNQDKVHELAESDGVVLHYQFSDWNAVQYKQAWYRCQELLNNQRSPGRINHMYSITLDQPSLKTETIPRTWIQDISVPKAKKMSHHKKQITSLFEQYGIEKFEPLQIWHIPELRELFIEKVGREPKSKVFPKWLVYLNKIRHGRK